MHIPANKHVAMTVRRRDRVVVEPVANQRPRRDSCRDLLAGVVGWRQGPLERGKIALQSLGDRLVVAAQAVRHSSTAWAIAFRRSSKVGFVFPFNWPIAVPPQRAIIGIWASVRPSLSTRCLNSALRECRIGCAIIASGEDGSTFLDGRRGTTLPKQSFRASSSAVSATSSAPLMRSASIQPRRNSFCARSNFRRTMSGMRGSSESVATNARHSSGVLKCQNAPGLPIAGQTNTSGSGRTGSSKCGKVIVEAWASLRFRQFFFGRVQHERLTGMYSPSVIPTAALADSRGIPLARIF